MQITDQRPGGVFSKRFWTEPRPKTQLSRKTLIWVPIALLANIAAFALFVTR